MAKGIQESNGRISIWKAISALLSFLLVVCTSLLGWVCFSVVDHEVRLTTIESNRFTTKDAMENYRSLALKIEKVERKVMDRLDEHKAGGHPQSVLREIQHLKDRFDDFKSQEK